MPETWRILKDFPLYEMNSGGDIRRVKSKKKTAPDTSMQPITSARRYRLTNETGRHLVWARTLQKQTFPEMFVN